MRSSDRLLAVVTQGLSARRERAFLAGCLALLLGYGAALLWLDAHADPIQEQFGRRREAFLLSRLALHPLPPGAPVGPGPARKAVPEIVLLDGWSVIEPEAGIVWSDGPRARLGIALAPAYRGGASIEMDVIANLDASGRQGIRAAAGGHPVGQWELRERVAVLRMELPPAAVQPSGALVLDLAIDAPHSPAPADPRRLGLALQQVTLRPAGR